MRMTYWRLWGLSSAVAILAAGSANAQSSTSQQLDELRNEVQALQRKIQQLEGKVAKTATKTERVERSAYAPPINPVAKAVAPAPTAVVKMSPANRPSICTVDNQNCVALSGRLHFDVGGYSYSPNSLLTTPQDLNNGVNARRARIGVGGTFMGDWNYLLAFEFGGSSDGLPPVAGAPTSFIHDAFLSYTALKPVAFEGGYTTLPITLDWATSSNDIMFMERASSSNIATNMVAGSYRSAVGFRATDDLFWAGAYLTGPTAGTTHIFAPTATAVGSPGTLGSPGFSEQMGAVGRATVQLLQDENYSLHVGGDAQFLITPPGTHTLTLSDRPELRIDPTSIVSTGAIATISHAQVYNVEAAAGLGPLFFQGEYYWYDVQRSFGLPSLHFNGWYAQGSWTITGEHRKYNPSAGSYAGIVPDYPFSLTTGGWGAWEIAARYSFVDLNDLFTPGIPTSVTHGVAGGTQGIYTVGLNWYINRNIRIMLNYLHGSVDKFSGATATAGADIGAKFDALAMRTQIAF